MSWLLALLTLASLAASGESKDGILRERVLTIIANSGAEVAVAFRTLDGRHELLLDRDKPFHAASTMKVPVMIELFRQAEMKQLSLDELLPVRNAFHSIVDGSLYQLDPGDDSDTEVYKSIGRSLTLEQLCEAMITVSSNLAANLLIERLGVEKIRRTVARLGADGMHVLRGVEDSKAFEKGLSNTTTARALLVLLECLARGQAVSRTADARMVAILERQKFNTAIPAGLPRGIAVAHKTGTITNIHHDAAIVYGSRPYVLVVLVRGLADEGQSAALIESVSREVWDAVSQ